MLSQRRELRWWYAKVYLEPQTQDAFLRNVRDLLAWHERRGTLEHWFYVRYRDHDESRGRSGGIGAPPTGHHIRLRLRCPVETFATWAAEVHTCLTNVASSARVEHADYRPEVTRYGGTRGLELAHAIFAIDSHVAVSLLPHVELNPLVAVVSSCALLVRLGLGAVELDQVYREHVGWIARQLRPSGPGVLLAEAGRSLDRQRERLMRAKKIIAGLPGGDGLTELGARLRDADSNGLIHGSLPEIYVDLQHMHLNRLGIPPRQEMSAILLGAVAVHRRILP